MKKKSIVLIVNLVLLAITLSIGVYFLDYSESIIQASAEAYGIEERINEGADFEDDSVIIVLKSEVSSFRGISNEIREKLNLIGVESIENLSELPANYVNTDGSINENAAPNLYSYYNATEFKQILYVKLLTAGKDNVLAAIEAVQKLDEVDYVGPNWVEETGVYIPNDTYYSRQWALNSNNGIKSEATWDLTRGSNEVKVGIIDSGISTDGDLSANIVTGYDFYNNNTITNDVQGGHGTHVAGIVAAVGNNNLGISGVAPNVKLVPLQTAYNTAGSGNHYTSDRIDAINYSISLWEDEDQRISILNHSIAGFGTNTDIAAAANNFPGLFVWSAGNDGDNTDSFSQISNFNLPNVISVGALTSTGARASYSNYGQNSVTIYAPGSDILSTFPSSLCAAGTCTANNTGGIHFVDGYHSLSGTSMAAPHVAGVAALILSVNPTLTGADLKNIIIDSADNITITVPNESGGTTAQNVKKLNAFTAVSMAAYETTDIGTNEIRIDGTNYNFENILNIPSSLNGRTVTQIGDSAFINQSNCKQVIIPDTVKSIGNNAFKNCSAITTISGLSNVEYIGDDAFNGCAALTNVVLPAGLTYIGERAFAYCDNLNIAVSASNPNYSAEGNILFDKNKTKILAAGAVASNITIPSTVNEIYAYSFVGKEALNEILFEGNLSIGQYAFADCTNIETVYFDSYTVPELLSNAFQNDSFVLYVPYNSQSAYESIFGAVATEVDSIQVQISFINDGVIIDTKQVYFGSTIAGLSTPTKTGYDFGGWYDNPEYAGDKYENGDWWNTKTDLTLYAKLDPKQFTISFAGEQSEGLNDKIVTYDSPIGAMPNVSRTGYAFLGWKDANGQYYTEDTIWKGLSNMTLTSAWDANEYEITYDGQGGTPSQGTQTVEYNAEIETLATCNRAGYTFMGWNTAPDGTGQDYEAPFSYTIDGDITLYAQWEATVYTIQYDLEGGTLVEENPSTYTILTETILLNEPTKAGYTFGGWKNGSETVTQIPKGSYGNLELSADWVANQYQVTLDMNGGEGDISYIMVTFMDDFSIGTVPTKVGYSFEGWYDNEDIQYATAAGESVRKWDKPYDATLQARWHIEKYEIQINDNGSITWLGASGISDEECEIEYGTTLNAINLIAIYKNSSAGYKEGKIFDHFEYEDDTWDWTVVPDLGEDGAIVTIIPVWVDERHTIYFETYCDVTIVGIEANYNTDISLPNNVARPHYNFIGWSEDEAGTKMVNWTKMPDLTMGEQSNGSIMLYAQYTPILYTITYELDGGINSPNNPSTYTIESEITLESASGKTGYLFNGWYLDEGKTQSIFELQEDYGNKTLYADWNPISYSIKYNANGGTGTMANSTHNYNLSQNLSSNTFTKTGYHFIGWATSSAGNIVYTDAQAVLNLTSNHGTIVNLYAKWAANNYTVQYNANGGIGTMTSSYHTYDISKTLNVNTFTRIGYHFIGWSTTSNGDVEYGNGQSVKNLTAEQGGTVTLFAKWEGNEYTVILEYPNNVEQEITATYGEPLPSGYDIPVRIGYDFLGFYDVNGTQYYNNEMEGINWNKTEENVVLTPRWELHEYNITLKLYDNVEVGTLQIGYGETVTASNMYVGNRVGYEFHGFYSGKNGTGTKYFDYDIQKYNNDIYDYRYLLVDEGVEWNKLSDGEIYGYWTVISIDYEYKIIFPGSERADETRTIHLTHGGNVTIKVPNEKDGNVVNNATYIRMYVNGGYYTATSYELENVQLKKNLGYGKDDGLTEQQYYLWYPIGGMVPPVNKGGLYMEYQDNTCIAEGSLITLADGSQKPVEELTGNEMLLVWNLLTGKFDVAPMVFIDSDPAQLYKVINLYFSDGTQVKVISEHAFWDFNLNRYVYLREDAAQYIGHWFNKQTTDAAGNRTWTKVQLVNVVVQQEYTTAWSPVTYGHLCYFVNGMLTIPGGIDGLFNIFEVDPETMMYDVEQMQADIAQYGLYTYEEFAAIFPVPEEIFDAFNAQYFKVAIGKGLLTMKRIEQLIEAYSEFF